MKYIYYFSYFLFLLNNAYAMNKTVYPCNTSQNPVKETILNRIKIIQTKEENLVYHGELRGCKISDILDILKSGKFVYDDQDIPYLPGPRLILGRTTIPTLQEYTKMILNRYKKYPINWSYDIGYSFDLDWAKPTARAFLY